MNPLPCTQMDSYHVLCTSLSHSIINHPPCTQMDSYLRSVGINFDEEEEAAAAANNNDHDKGPGSGSGQEEVVTMEEDN